METMINPALKQASLSNSREGTVRNFNDSLETKNAFSQNLYSNPMKENYTPSRNSSSSRTERTLSLPKGVEVRTERTLSLSKGNSPAFFKSLMLTLAIVVAGIGSVWGQCGPFQVYESLGGGTTTPSNQGGTWVYTSLTNTTISRTGLNGFSLNASADAIRTPQIASPGIFSFWFRRSGTSAAHNFVVETSTDGTNWTTRDTYSGTMSTTYTQRSVNLGTLSLTNVFVRVRDTRASGANLWYLDDVSWTSTNSTSNTILIQGQSCTPTLTAGVTYSVYDRGGVNDQYSISQTTAPMVLTPPAGYSATINFTTLATEASYDFLRLYNGTTTAATALHSGTGWSGSTAPGSFTASNASYSLTVDFTSDASTNGNGFVGSLTFALLPSCSALPSALTSSVTSTTTATLSWTAASPAPGSGYDIYYSTSATAPIAGTAATTTTAAGVVTKNITGLTASTTYYWWVRSNCNGTNKSSWVSGGTFFTGYCQPSNTTTGDYISSFSTSGGSLNISSSGIGTGALEDYTAQVVSQFATGTVSFSGAYVGGNAGFSIWVDWNNNLVFDASERMFNASATAASWTGSFVVPTGQALGNYRMRIRAQWNTLSPPSCGAIGYGQAEDYTFSVIAAPACAQTPSGLTASVTSGTSANVSWTAASPAPGSGYDIYYSTSSTAPIAGTPATTTTASGVVTKSITGLTANTTYYWWVRSNCNGTDKSSWVSGGTFFTGYCLASGTGANTSITNFVTTGGVTNISNATGFSAGGYGNFTGQSCSQLEGQAIAFTLTFASDPGISIYIDWNNDLDFADAGELVLSSNGYITGPATGTLTVPAGQAVGNYRMRVVLDWNGTTPIACPTSINGEIEDYTFTVTCSPAQPSAITGSLTPEVGSSQTYSVTDVAGVTETWSFPSGWVITGGQGTNSVTVTVGGNNGTITVTPSIGACNGTARTATTTIPNYRWKYISSNLGSATWTSGEARNVSITIQNTGVGTWNSGVTTNAAIRWDSDNSNAAFSPWVDYHSRVTTGTVSPGSQVTCTVPIEAKNATSGPTYSTNLADGTYYLAFDLVNEGSCWFGGAAGGTGACTAGNTPWYSSAQTVSTVSTLSCSVLTAFGNVCTNATSTNSFIISGVNLTNNVSVGASTGYTYSTTSNGTYTSTLTLTPSGGSLNQTVFVKFTPTAVASYSGTIVVSSTGATSQNVSASGTGIAGPTVNAGSDFALCSGQTVALSGSTNATSSSGSVSATYSGGNGNSLYNLTPTTATNSSCPIPLSVSIPAGAVITGVNVTYNMTAASGAWMSEQQTYLKCTSSGGVSEASMSGGSGNLEGTMPYSRSNLTIANGVSGGGTINFQLHAFRTWGGAGCEAVYNYVNNNSFTITVNYTINPTYAWSPATALSATNILNPNCSATSTTTYTLTVTGVNGCSNSTTQPVTVTVNQPTINITVNNTSIGNDDYLWNGNTSPDGSVASNWYVLNNNVYSIASQAPTAATEVFIVSYTDASTCVSQSNSASIPASGSFTAGNMYVGADASIALGTSATLNVSGNFTNNGTFTPGTGTVNMNGSSAQTINGSAAITFNNLTINNAAGVSLTTDINTNGILTLTNGALSLGAQNLTIGTGGSIAVTSPSASRMISTSGSGELRKRFAQASNQDPANFLFPIGTPGEYTPVNLDFSDVDFGNEAYMRTRSVAQKSSFMNASISTYLDRNWIVEPVNISNFTYDITYTYAQEDYVGSAGAEGQLKPIKYSTPGGVGQWYQPQLAGFDNAEEIGDGTVNSTSNVAQWTGLNSFSEFGGAEGNGQPLPVELVSFTGACEEGVINLTWQTASEFNSEHFDVEKSRDGENWLLLTTMPAAGTSNELITYQYGDDQATDGNNYFRLRQVDIDGTEKLYDPINVSCKEVTTGYFTSYPNPSGSSFQIVVNNKELLGNCVMNIVDASGKVIEQLNIEVKEGINLFMINQALNPGIYFLNITNGDKTTPVLRHAVN